MQFTTSKRNEIVYEILRVAKCSYILSKSINTLDRNFPLEKLHHLLMSIVEEKNQTYLKYSIWKCNIIWQIEGAKTFSDAAD